MCQVGEEKKRKKEKKSTTFTSDCTSPGMREKGQATIPGHSPFRGI